MTGWQGDKETEGALWAQSPHHPVTSSPSHLVTQSNLPVQTTPFVGRKHELADLIRSLAEPNCRLLSLVGPGGIGKTRLAIEAAQTILDPSMDSESSLDPKSKIQNPKFADGVFFVALQPVSTPSGLVSTISAALGFHFYDGAPPQQQLLNFLREKQALLILDNFEHLLPGAGLVGEILASAPSVKVLVTSREALKLAEEWFHPLAGMRLPPSERVTTWQGDRMAGAQSPPHPVTALPDAIELFIQTARRAKAGFEPEAHYVDIVRICRLVDGMPLAIVLAASWLKVLSSAQIASEIEQSMDILVTRYQNIPERHRSMRAVLEHSWRLLSEDAQQVLRRMSVFQGSFLPDAAAIIAGATFMTLSELVEKAWLYLTPGERYQLHELLRQFAGEELAQQAMDEAETRDRHAEFYLRQIAQREHALQGPEQRVALSEIDIEIENTRAAWYRAAGHGHVELLDEALHGLYLFFHIRSRYAEGQELLAHALYQLDAIAAGEPLGARRLPDENAGTYLPHSGVGGLRARLQARLRARIGSFFVSQGDLDAANTHFEAVLSSSTEHRELAFVYALLGNAARWRGDRPSAESALQKSLTHARICGNHNLLAETLLVLSDTKSSFGDFAGGERYARESLALCRKLQRPDLTAHVLAALAWATNCLGGYAESARYYRESLAIAESIGNPFGIALAIQFLGWVAFCEGGQRLVEALALYKQALAVYRQIGHRNLLAMSLGDYALAASEVGDAATAFRCAEEGLAITEEIDHRALMSYNLNCLGAAACGLNDLEASRRYLLRALQISAALQIPDSAALTLYLFAQLLLKEGERSDLPASEKLQKQGQAVELLALVINQPATWQLIRDRAQRVLAELLESLPADTAATAQQRGREKTLEDIATEVLDDS
jgi:predicted ATPase